MNQCSWPNYEGVLDAFWRGDHAAVINDMPACLGVKPEARFGHYLAMVGAVVAAR